MSEENSQIKSEIEVEFNFENGILVKNGPNKPIVGEISLILGFILGFSLFVSISIIIYKYGWMVQQGYYLFDGGMMQALSVLSAFFLYFLIMKLKSLFSKNLTRFIVLVIASLVLLVNNTLLLNEYYTLLIISPDVDFILAGHTLQNGFVYFALVSSASVIITLSCFKSVFFPKKKIIKINGIYKEGVVRNQVFNIFRYLLGIDGIYEHEYIYENKTLKISKKMLKKASFITLICLSSTGLLLLVCGYISFLAYLIIIEILSLILSILLILMLKTLWDLKINIDQNIISETALKSLTSGEKVFIKRNLAKWNISPIENTEINSLSTEMSEDAKKKSEDNLEISISDRENKSKLRWIIEMIELVICLGIFIYMIYNIAILKTDNTILPPAIFAIFNLLILIHNFILNRLAKPKSILDLDKIQFYKLRRKNHLEIIPYLLIFLIINLCSGFIYFQNSDIKIITGQFGFVMLVATVVAGLGIILHNHIKIKLQLGIALVLLIFTFYIINNSLIYDLTNGIYLGTYSEQPYTTEIAQGFVHTILIGSILGLSLSALFSSFLESGLTYIRFNSNRKVIERNVFTQTALIFTSIFGLLVGITLGKDLKLSGPHDGDFPSQFENIIEMNSIIIMGLAIIVTIYIVLLAISYAIVYSKKRSADL